MFRVTRRNSGESIDVTTNANGTVLADTLEPGWYEVYELRAPTGYTTDGSKVSARTVPLSLVVTSMLSPLLRRGARKPAVEVPLNIWT